MKRWQGCGAMRKLPVGTYISHPFGEPSGDHVLYDPAIPLLSVQTCETSTGRNVRGWSLWHPLYLTIPPQKGNGKLAYSDKKNERDLQETV